MIPLHSSRPEDALLLPLAQPARYVPGRAVAIQANVDYLLAFLALPDRDSLFNLLVAFSTVHDRLLLFSSC